MSRIITSISILESLRNEALNAAKKGQYPGSSNFSAMVELALDKLLHQDTVPNTQVELEVPA